MTKKSFLSLFIGFMLVSSNARAVSTDWKKITRIGLGWQVKRVNLIMSGTIPNPANCGFIDAAQADENLPNLDHVLSTALAAFMGGKEVLLVIADATCSAGDRPRIMSLNIR